MRLFNRSQGQEEDGSGSDDGDQTLDLSVSRDTDGQVGLYSKVKQGIQNTIVVKLFIVAKKRYYDEKICKLFKVLFTYIIL